MTMTTDTWLSLSEAAHRLGVHENTLRRWTDQGRIGCTFTLGGHRRFAERDIEALLGRQARLPAVRGLADAWVETALAHTRHELTAHGEEAWVNTFSSAQRDEKRELGRRLMALVLQYVSQDAAQPHNGAAILAEAAAVGAAYARTTLEVNMPLSDVLSAIMFFRDMLMQTALDLPDSVNARSQDQKRLMGRVAELLNTVELAVVRTYESHTV